MAEDSYLLFNLPVPKTRDVCFDNIDKPSYMLATVVEKQFCLVKRDGSRYRLLNGTKFYRVSVRPLSGHSSKTPKVDMEKVRKELADGKWTLVDIYRVLMISTKIVLKNALHFF